MQFDHEQHLIQQHKEYISNVSSSPKSTKHRLPSFAEPITDATVENIIAGRPNPRRVEEVCNTKGPTWCEAAVQAILLKYAEKYVNERRSSNLTQAWRDYYEVNPSVGPVSVRVESVQNSFKERTQVPLTTLCSYWHCVQNIHDHQQISYAEAIYLLQFPRSTVLFPDYYEYIEDDNPLWD